MGYALRYGRVILAIPEGRTLIGREPRAVVRLTDEAVSRRHASLVLSTAGLFIEDLKSRTGVMVNGDPVKGRRRLHPGDRIRIGENELGVELEQGSLPGTEWDAAAGGATTNAAPGFAVHREAAMHLLADGKIAEARELIASDVTAVLLLGDSGKRVANEDVDGTARCSLQLARSTCEARWVDAVFQMYARLRAPIPSSILADLQATAPAVAPIGAEAFHAYLQVAREITGPGAQGGMLLRSLEALVPFAT
jgi:FHA domain-containing protein